MRLNDADATLWEIWRFVINRTDDSSLRKLNKQEFASLQDLATKYQARYGNSR